MIGGLGFPAGVYPSIELPWLAIIAVNISRGNELWWRPCMGIHISEKWFATSADCFIGEYRDSTGSVTGLELKNHEAWIASGFYAESSGDKFSFTTNSAYWMSDLKMIPEYADDKLPYFLKGRLVMVRVARHPYYITNAPLSAKKFDIEKFKHEKCFIVSLDDKIDAKNFPTFLPSLREFVVPNLNDCSKKHPPKYHEKHFFDFCSNVPGSDGVCAHDIGAPIICKNIVQGLIYRVESGVCPINSRGFLLNKFGEPILGEHPHLHKESFPSGDTSMGFLDVSQYIGTIQKILKNEGEYENLEDPFMLRRRKSWKGAPDKDEGNYNTFPFPEKWHGSTMIFEEWPITMEDEEGYEDTSTKKMARLKEESQVELGPLYDDYEGANMKCRYNNGETIYICMEVLSLVVLNIFMIL